MISAKGRTEELWYWVLIGLGTLVSAIGLGAAYTMEHHGHVITGMNNQTVWGLPHVFAIFLIIAASGVLNIASVGSVFGKPVYKARGALSGLLSIVMLAAGLTVIMLDLGRADRLVIAMTHFNPSSIFGWNVILYPVMFTLVALYMWMLMEGSMYPFARPAGFAVFIWRLILTTGTGSIFGFLVARQAYQSAVLAPMFIIMSFAWGLAVFLIVQEAMYAWNTTQLHELIRSRLRKLLGVFLAAVFYFVLVYHLTNLYFARQTDFEQFILLDGGVFPGLFWGGWLFVGTIVPMLLIYVPSLAKMRLSTSLASILVIIGAFCQLYVFIIGGQAYPLDIFPGWELIDNSHAVDHYTPSLPEILLGIGGLAIAFTMTTIGVRVFDLLPRDDIATWQAENKLTD